MSSKGTDASTVLCNSVQFLNGFYTITFEDSRGDEVCIRVDKKNISSYVPGNRYKFVVID